MIGTRNLSLRCSDHGSSILSQTTTRFLQFMTKRSNTSEWLRGSAAAQCGEARPHRRAYTNKEEASPPLVKAQPRRWRPISSFSVSQRLTALCCGRAAIITSFFLIAYCVVPSASAPSLTVGLLTRAFSQTETPPSLSQPSPTPAPSPSPSPTPPPNL